MEAQKAPYENEVKYMANWAVAFIAIHSNHSVSDVQDTSFPLVNEVCSLSLSLSCMYRKLSPFVSDIIQDIESSYTRSHREGLTRCKVKEMALIISLHYI